MLVYGDGTVGSPGSSVDQCLVIPLDTRKSATTQAACLILANVLNDPSKSSLQCLLPLGLTTLISKNQLLGNFNHLFNKMVLSYQVFLATFPSNHSLSHLLLRFPILFFPSADQTCRLPP